MNSSFSPPSSTAKVCAVCVGGPLIALSIGAPVALASPSDGSATGGAQKQTSSNDKPKAGPRSQLSAARPRAADEPQPSQDFALSFNGRTVVQSGSATATSDPGFNFAVAGGAGSSAHAGGGFFNIAVADHNSTATATGGILNFASADNDSTATAQDGIFTVAQAQKNGSTATVSGGKLNIADANNGSTASVSGGDRNQLSPTAAAVQPSRATETTTRPLHSAARTPTPVVATTCWSPRRSAAASSPTAPSQSTELTVASQIGTSTLIACGTVSFGAVTTKAPHRGHALPVVASIAEAETSAVAVSPGFRVRRCAALAGRRGTLISTPPAGVTRSAPG